MSTQDQNFADEIQNAYDDLIVAMKLAEKSGAVVTLVGRESGATAPPRTVTAHDLRDMSASVHRVTRPRDGSPRRVPVAVAHD